MFVDLQTWLLRSAGAVAQPASAIYVAIFNAAIGTGAFVGGQLIASAGLSGMVWLAAGIMVGSTLLIALLKAPLPVRSVRRRQALRFAPARRRHRSPRR